MSKHNNVEDLRDALIAAGVIVVGVAVVVEMRYIMPHDPLAAMFTVTGAALIATAITLRLSRR